MQTINLINQLRQQIKQAQQRQLTIGFVPTMGFLHQGHASLIHQARAQCDLVVVSIFVNPLQFAPTEDLSRYPRDLIRDSKLCADAGVDILFVPEVNEILGTQTTYTQVSVSNLDQYLCGASRRGHFAGVATIVTKLFNLVQPQRAYFGLKDIQQFKIIQQMVADLNFPIELIGVNTVRDHDGLALSSRNSYLDATQRQQALVVPQLIELISQQLIEAKLNRQQIIAKANDYLFDKVPTAQADYIEIVDNLTLHATDNFKQDLIVAIAIFIGKTRLIDNQQLKYTDHGLIKV
ncbi:MAG: hypothetical protein RLZZ293_1198 [Pseudomonadota bacterium]|jgi:pantoate--beta-alanine ligase